MYPQFILEIMNKNDIIEMDIIPKLSVYAISSGNYSIFTI